MSSLSLGELTYVISKGTTPSSIGLSFATAGIPFLKGEDVLGREIDFATANTFISEESHHVLNRSSLEYGDVLITIAGTIGRIGFIAQRSRIANCNQAVAFVRPDRERIDPQWLCYLLQSSEYQAKFAEFVAGGAIPNVNLQQIRSLEIPSLDIDQQRHIAARLKAQLAEVETARQAAQVQVKEIKCLVDAIIRQGTDTPSGNVVAIGEVAWIDARIVDPTEQRYAGLPHISAENIFSVTGNLHSVRSASEDGMESGKYLFHSGNVLYSKLRPYLRKASVVQFDGLCSADMYPLRFEENHVDSEYLRTILVSDAFTEYANEMSARSRMPKLNREQLFAYRFHLPPIEEQRRIVTRLKAQLAEAAAIAQAATTQLAEIERLPQRILAQAFNKEGSTA